eukprot:scaffold292581_cov19-Tisochrysis_lutea.AAC.1
MGQLNPICHAKLQRPELFQDIHCVSKALCANHDNSPCMVDAQLRNIFVAGVRGWCVVAPIFIFARGWVVHWFDKTSLRLHFTEF